MSDENGVLRITDNDVQEANQLSLACPICAGPVEKHIEEAELAPVVCVKCGTLYHRACWERNNGKCAILGCGSTQYRVYGRSEAVLKITAADLPSDAEIARQERAQKTLKQVERERARVASQSQSPNAAPRRQPRGFWAQLFEAIRRAFGG